jgi:hypothetical protein
MLTTNHEPKARAERCSCGVPIPPGREACSKCAAEWERIDHVDGVRPLLEDALVLAIARAPLTVVVAALAVELSFAALETNATAHY